MNQTAANCPKCAGAMEEGFILDRAYGANVPSSRVEGEPVKSFWSGTKITGKTRSEIKSLRCAARGFLEFYAVETDAADNSSAFS